MPVNVLPSDTFVAQAFAELLADVTNLLVSAEVQKPRDKEEIAFWRRQQRAMDRAEYHWRSGVRPVFADGAYLVPSASQGGSLIHRLTKHGGVLVCNCPAGERGILCWHHMMCNIAERAIELEDLAIDALADRAAAADILADAAELRAEATPEVPPEPVEGLAGDEPPMRPLGARLAEARMRYAA